jgi:hypothetical protein
MLNKMKNKGIASNCPWKKKIKMEIGFKE